MWTALDLKSDIYIQYSKFFFFLMFFFFLISVQKFANPMNVQQTTLQAFGHVELKGFSNFCSTSVLEKESKKQHPAFCWKHLESKVRQPMHPLLSSSWRCRHFSLAYKSFHRVSRNRMNLFRFWASSEGNVDVELIWKSMCNIKDKPTTADSKCSTEL